MVIRYVGQTTIGVDRRLREHIKRAKSAVKPVHRDNWIMSVIRSGGAINVVVLQENAVWNESEREWIERLRQSSKLVNATAGGEGMLGAPAELRERISRAVKSLWLSEDYRSKAAGSRKGAPWSEAQKKARSSVPAFVRSDRARRGRLKVPGERRSEISSLAALAGWAARREKGTDRGQSVNSAKLSDSQVSEIRMRRAQGEPASRIAVEFGMSVGAICKVVNGVTWRHLAVLEAPKIVVRGEMSGTATLTESQVMEIRRRAARGERLSDIGAIFGKSRMTIRGIVVGASWKHLPVLGYKPNSKHKKSKSSISESDVEAVLAMRSSGMKMTDIAKQTGLAYHVVRYAVRRDERAPRGSIIPA